MPFSHCLFMCAPSTGWSKRKVRKTFTYISKINLRNKHISHFLRLWAWNIFDSVSCWNFFPYLCTICTWLIFMMILSISKTQELSTIGASGEVKGKTGKWAIKYTFLRRSSIWENVQARHTNINVPCSETQKSMKNLFGPNIFGEISKLFPYLPFWSPCINISFNHTHFYLYVLLPYICFLCMCHLLTIFLTTFITYFISWYLIIWKHCNQFVGLIWSEVK